MKSFSSFMLAEKQVPYYKDWGWIDPKGALINGVDSAVNTHRDLLPDGLGTETAIFRGWVRWYITSDSEGTNFIAEAETPRAIANIRQWLKNGTKTFGYYSFYHHGDGDDILRVASESEFLLKLKKYA